MKRSLLTGALQALALASLLTLSTVQAAEETLKIKGELLFASLPQLGDYQGPLAEPLVFEATIVEDAALAESTVILGLSEEYLNATRSIAMEISTAAGEVLYSASAHADEFAFATSLELYSLFAYGADASATNYPSGSAFWALISAGEQRFVDREINLGADLLSRGVGMGAEASTANLFADMTAYPVLTAGSYNYAFLYYDRSVDNQTGEGYQGIAQGYATSVSYGAEDFSLEALLAACGDTVSCAMRTIQNWQKNGSVTSTEASSLRQAYQASQRPN
ncbi:hypothetical protein [Pseudidiomarina homiensis]|uniref:Uncharacterized protein n=1 Tax=Pseudidiomarina homiensis TaxID=364198 RepID=A0A432Y651_9GAMM|nr:hypothetical protein [Pseudidiomarina homiensis]RUO56316.1 hypothetical protein CWI70_06085 [Pseudidiomarina homiensis]